MARPEAEKEEPLTPASRLFVRPEMNQIINCIIGLKRPVDVAAVTSIVANSAMVKLPRFSSLMVRDRHGREYWRKTQLDISRHIIVHDDRIGDIEADEEAANDYVADLSVTSELSTDKPLWEIHFLRAHNCAVFRAHHALGDGISLMSMFLACFRTAEDPERRQTLASSTARRENWRVVLWKIMKAAILTVVFAVEFMLRAFWVRDRSTALSGGAGVELWPRKLSTAKFRLDDMKMVKRAVTGATINDVLFGVISAGLSRYLDVRSPEAAPEGLRITGAAMVNLRKNPGMQDLSDLMKRNSGARWGNKFGMILLPVYYHKSGDDPMQYVKRAKAMIDQKKLSLEAQFSYRIGYFVMSFFGPKLAWWLNYRVLCNTTFTISNVIGPQEEILVAGNPVTYMRVNTTSLPHAITMHMMSYAGRADMQILVAKDIIDSRVLAKCFEDALLEMRQAAEGATAT